MDIKLGKQIAFLRQQKGMTQQDLASALNVTNQSVSKWESDKCCPDIALLPDIAELFSVSLDQLFGYSPKNLANDDVLALRNRVESLTEGKDFEYILKTAYALHSIIFSKYMTSPENGDTGWDTDDAIEHAEKAEWGYSCINQPEFTTYMRCGSVFFSNNTNPQITCAMLRRLSSLFKTFSNFKVLGIMKSIFDLTVHDENAYTTAKKIADECGLTEDEIISLINNELSTFIIDRKDESEYSYRINGMYMHLIPLFLTLCQ